MSFIRPTSALIPRVTSCPTLNQSHLHGEPSHSKPPLEDSHHKLRPIMAEIVKGNEPTKFPVFKEVDIIICEKDTSIPKSIPLPAKRQPNELGIVYEGCCYPTDHVGC